MPHRTRAELEKFLNENTSVVLSDGRRITNAANLPSDAELAAVHRDHLVRTRDAAAEAGQTKDVATIQKEIDEADKAAGKAATKVTAAAEEEVTEGFAHLSADELKALCEEHDCQPDGRATKANMAKALADKGVRPPE